MSRKKIEILFLLFFMAVTGTIIGRSMQYTLKSYLLPLLVGILIFVLMVVQIIREVLSRKEAPPVPKDETRPGRGIFAAASLFALILLIYLVGFVVAVPVGVFAYIIISGEKWYLALGLGLVMLLIVLVLHALGLYLYEGILLS